MPQLLAIMAHPDDAELLCGGALLHARDHGHNTGVLDLTRGEAGSWGDPSLRATEAANAATILGLDIRANAELADGALENTPAARLTVARHLRVLRPDTVILHWPDHGRHPDHRIASQLAYDACFIAGLRNAPIDGEPHRPRKILHAMAYREEPIQPRFVLDITHQMERKLDAIFAFSSQFAERTSMGDVFGGGVRPLREQILAHHAHYGSLIRRPFGEPYWTRETLEVHDIIGLAVNSI